MNEKILLPAIQGEFGDWVYYAAMMKLSDVADRVGFARDIHTNNRLADRIQRELQDIGNGKKNRANEISIYLSENKSRFLNSIVLGIYGGKPVWHPFDVKPKSSSDVPDDTVILGQERVGFLELNGTEEIFALDGQHRLAGIQNAVGENNKLEHDSITVLFVPHERTPKGLLRTRKLFVDLNKRAVPVARKDIIALDEVDLAAIIARRLVDEHKWFSNGQIDIERFNTSLSVKSPALMSIGTLYDINKIILPRVIANSEKEKEEIVLSQRLRLPDDRIEHYLRGAIYYFEKLSLLDKQLKSYFNSGAESGIAQIARSQNESNILFRPVGQLIFADVIGALSSEYGSKKAFVYAKKIPTSLNETPYKDVIWDAENRRIFAAKNKGIAAKLLQYMLGLEINQKEKLREKYSELRDVENGRLPNKLF